MELFSLMCNFLQAMAGLSLIIVLVKCIKLFKNHCNEIESLQIRIENAEYRIKNLIEDRLGGFDEDV